MPKRNSYFALAMSIVMYVVMFPVATGDDPWPIERFSCLFAWMFLVPLWMHLRHAPRKTVLWQGYLFCFFSTLGTLYWFYIAMKHYGNMPGWESLLILVAAGFLVGTIRWFAFFATSRIQSIQNFPLAAAMIFTLVEWAQLYIPFQGFPWITPAYAILPMHNFVQSADLFGMTGINFLLFYTNFLVIEFKVEKLRGETPQKNHLIRLTLALVILVFYGTYRLSTFKNEGEPLQVALLQGNIAQDIKWSPKDREDIIQNYFELTRLATASNPDLIVWPEASWPITVHTERTKIDTLPNIGPENKYVMGAPTWFRKDGKTHYQNSAFTLLSDGKIEHRYDKVRLVPFGEYIPNFGPVPIKKFVPAVAGDFSSGTFNQKASQIKGHSFGLFICFEVLFPDIARSWVDRGAQFFVNITNDAWFDRSSGPFQHLRFAALRAIEFRKPLVRAANTGVTTWFDALGNQHDSLQLFTRGQIIANIYPNNIKTLYGQFPHLVPLLLWIATLGILMIERKRIA